MLDGEIIFRTDGSDMAMELVLESYSRIRPADI
ncbi:MAG: hypothetical protein RIR09_3125 [Pseudomonadota bacterium]|jgi:hypothetical protein